MHLVDNRALSLQSKIWKWFEKWCLERVNPASFESALRQPALLSLLVREFGRFLFVQGKSLYVLRHLVVLVQKQVLGSRAFMGVCWDLIQKWEELEPPIHRIPVPVSVVRAMTCISLHWGWRRFAGSVLSSFFAIMRPGEFLRAIRRDLVLPSDLLRNEEVPVFLRVREPKSRRRGATECSMLVYMTQPFVAASMFFSVNCLLTIPFIPLAQQAIEEDGIASCCTLASP